MVKVGADAKRSQEQKNAYRRCPASGARQRPPIVPDALGADLGPSCTQGQYAQADQIALIATERRHSTELKVQKSGEDKQGQEGEAPQAEPVAVGQPGQADGSEQQDKQVGPTGQLVQAPAGETRQVVHGTGTRQVALDEYRIGQKHPALRQRDHAIDHDRQQTRCQPSQTGPGAMWERIPLRDQQQQGRAADQKQPLITGGHQQRRHNKR